jgi:hypothetical protein
MNPYAQRRARVLAKMREQGGGVAIIPTAPEVMRNADADYPYRHDSYFYYLTGFTEPEATLVLIAGRLIKLFYFVAKKMKNAKFGMVIVTAQQQRKKSLVLMPVMPSIPLILNYRN